MRAVVLAALVASIGTAWPANVAEEAFVTNQLSNNLSVVDLTSLQPIATIAIDGKPAGVAITPDGRFAYVTSPDAKAPTVVDAAARRVVAGSMPAVVRSVSQWRRMAPPSMSPTGTPRRCG